MNPRTAFADALLARQIARRYLKKMGMEHDSPEALKDYLKEHPGADKSKHHVKKDEGKDEGGKMTAKPGKKEQDLGGELSQWQGPGQPGINHVNSYLQGGHPVSHEMVEKAIKEMEKNKAGASGKDKEHAEKMIDGLNKLIGKGGEAKSEGGGKPVSVGGKSFKPSQLADQQHVIWAEAYNEMKKSLGEDFRKNPEVAEAWYGLGEVLDDIKDAGKSGDIEKGEAEELTKKLEKAYGKLKDEAAKAGKGTKPAKKRVKAVKDVMSKHDLKDDDADEVEDFVKRKPDKGKKLTDAQLMQKFLREASPETRERMKGMSVGDFKAMYAAIMDEEGEGAAKSAAVRLVARFVESAKPKTTKLPKGGPKVRVYDNGGKTIDRYTVVIDDSAWEANPGMMPMLGLSEGGRGFSQFSDGREGPHLGKGVNFDDLDDATKKHIIFRLTEEGEGKKSANELAGDKDAAAFNKSLFLDPMLKRVFQSKPYNTTNGYEALVPVLQRMGVKDIKGVVYQGYDVYQIFWTSGQDEMVRGSDLMRKVYEVLVKQGKTEAVKVV